MTEIDRLPNETEFEWKLRVCLMKKRKETDLDWSEICEHLHLDINPDQLRKQAVGYYEYDEYLHNSCKDLTCILSISDLHYPFVVDMSHLKEYAGRVDVLQLNGDIIDCNSLSKFPKTFHISPIDEIIGARQYLIDLINYLKPKRVVANYGNHDLRLGNYLAKNLDNELQELMPTTALDYIFVDGFTHYDRKIGAKINYSPLTDVFPEIDIDFTGTWYSQIGDCVFAHPKTFSAGPLKTAEKALYWFRNEGFIFSNLIMAHTHRIGSYKVGNSNIYEQGAFCKTELMEYSDGLLINSQKQGFIVLYQDSDGKTMVDKTAIKSIN